MSVNAIDQMPGAVNILMMKKVMELAKDVGQQMVQVLQQSAQQAPRVNPPGIGGNIDLLM